MGAYVSLSNILRGTDHGLAFHCPGCNAVHIVNTRPGNGPTWTWDGNVEKPTLSPSILVTTGREVDPTCDPWEPGYPPERCHSFVRDGRVEFCTDSKHALAGQTVDLPPWPDRGSP